MECLNNWSVYTMEWHRTRPSAIHTAFGALSEVGRVLSFAFGLFQPDTGVAPQAASATRTAIGAGAVARWKNSALADTASRARVMAPSRDEIC